MRKRKIKFWLLIILLSSALQQPCFGKDTGPYITQGNCDGFPKIDLKVAPSICIGVVATNLHMARGVAAIGPEIYVTDLGDWSKGKGRLLHIGNHGQGKPEVILDHLDEPNSLAPAPGGTLYMGLLGKIIQYDPTAHTTRDVVVNLPTEGKHPLAAFSVAPDGSLFINIGSATDHCEKGDGSVPDPVVPCPETVSHTPPRGSLLHVMPQAEPVNAQIITPYAVGMRNSMALAVSPSGKLYDAVNARDAINQADPGLSDEDLPHDTFNRVEQGKDYGWPYCYDNNIPSPEYPQYDCSKKQLPTLLLPAHAAPLGMLFYTGRFLPSFHNKLVIGYHGYRKQGHRIVTLALNKNGLPKSAPIEIVGDWDMKPGNHPQGSPVSLFEYEDGSILIVEDRNGTLLRISRESSR